MTISVCSHRHSDTSHLIDNYVLERIDFRARRLAIRFRLPDDRRDDLAQEMTHELLKAATRFDPDGSAAWHTYACRVLDLAVKKLIQSECRTRKREAGGLVRFSESPDGCSSAANCLAMAVDDPSLIQFELRMDVEMVLARMPERLRRVCLLLMELTPAEAAEALGIHRNSIYRLIAQIRAYFMDPRMGFCESSAADSAVVRM
ncbi:MAG TPA: sigma-70 family RNA polymerase sigma factor [Phycisphaerales bacterium]|nr:sigma-70 family RNA polymerase sigma factor [Phycisphaerales bacterium]